MTIDKAYLTYPTAQLQLSPTYIRKKPKLITEKMGNGKDKKEKINK